MTPPEDFDLGLVASDIDGTLLLDWKPISTATIDAIHRCQDMDIPFVLVTGRPIRWLETIADQIPGRDAHDQVLATLPVLVDGLALVRVVDPLDRRGEGRARGSRATAPARRQPTPWRRPRLISPAGRSGRYACRRCSRRRAGNRPG